MTTLTDLSLLDAAAALRSGEASSVDLTRACLERIEALEHDMHAFLVRTPELALKQAQAADRRLQEWQRKGGDPLPLTCGIPIAVKDVLCLDGVPTTCGSKILEGFCPPYSATSVTLLIDSGAVIPGRDVGWT